VAPAKCDRLSLFFNAQIPITKKKQKKKEKPSLTAGG
jgi:hypothetical protein